MMNQWLLENKVVSSLDDICAYISIKDMHELYGFIYMLTLKEKETNKEKYYIGKKNFFYRKEAKSLQSKLPRKGHEQFIRHIRNHKKVEYEVYKVETDWLKYEGSYEENFKYELQKKEILEISKTKRYLTYLEAKYLFLHNAIIDEAYINKNILGSFFRGNILEDDSIDWRERDLAKGGEYLPCS